MGSCESWRLSQPDSLSCVQAQLPPDLDRAFSIRSMTSADWSDVERIYLAGIATGHATFETTSPDWDKWDADHLAEPRLVAVESDDRAVGWAAGSAVSERCVYGGVIEHSVYVDPHDGLAVLAGYFSRPLLANPSAWAIGRSNLAFFPRTRRAWHCMSHAASGSWAAAKRLDFIWACGAM